MNAQDLINCVGPLDEQDSWSLAAYIWYLADGVESSVEEAARKSMSRAWTLAQRENCMALITAFRGERKYTHNSMLNRSLAHDIRQLGYGFTPVIGSYIENVKDEDGNETGEKRRVFEDSFIVSGGKDNKKFAQDMISLAAKYGQESVAVKHFGTNHATLYSLTGKEDRDIGVWNADTLSEIYTKMRKGPPDRIFAFEAAGDESRSTVWAVSSWKKSRIKNKKLLDALLPAPPIKSE